MWITDPNSQFRKDMKEVDYSFAVKRQKVESKASNPPKPLTTENRAASTTETLCDSQTILNGIQRDDEHLDDIADPNRTSITPSQKVLDDLSADLRRPSALDTAINAGDIPDQTKETPQRQWIIGDLAATDTIAGLAAPGGTGKSLFLLLIAVAVAVGKPLLGSHFPVTERRKVLLLNNEDPDGVTHQRLGAIYARYGLTKEDTKDWLFIRGGYGSPLRIAETLDRESKVASTNQATDLIHFCIEKKIGFIAMDPFVSLHDAPENNNTLQNEVINILKHINAATNAGILIATHVPKTKEDTEAHAGDMDSVRGASAIKDGMRAVHTLAPMAKKTMKDEQIDYKMGSTLVRLDNAKQNYGPKSYKAKWYRLDAVSMPNGETCVVPVYVDELNLLFTATSQYNTGMTAEKWAEVIEDHAGNDTKMASSFKYADVNARLVEASGYKKSKVAEFVTLLSKDNKVPTCITAETLQVEYWIEKDGNGRTAPWVVHRKVLK
jgi:hypothetical protein